MVEGDKGTWFGQLSLVIDFSEPSRAHAGDVHRFVWFLSGDPALADDIHSETFIRLSKRFCYPLAIQEGDEDMKREPTRRDVLRVTVASMLSAVVGAGADGQEGRGRPNILWLVSEDNNPFLGCYGDALAHTPNIDALARRGLLFRHAFCAAPVCAPSRFSILTGVYPQSCAPANHMRAVATLPAFLKTYPEYLREAGYYCTNNSKTDFNCNADGTRIFDESSNKAHYSNRPAGKPFFAVFNYMSSHESCLFGVGSRGPGAGRADHVRPADVRVPAYLPDTPEVRDDRAAYYDAVERMDGEIGARLKGLEQAGLAADTIVFYYSDNGGVLPRSKRYCYNEGLRCAMVVAFPKKWQHLAPATMGTVIEEPVSLVDLAPTLLSLVGTPIPPHMQGRAFAGPQAGSRRPYAFGMRNRMDERYDFVRAATDGRFHYIRNYTPHRTFQHGAYEWQLQSYQSWEREWRAGRLDAAQRRFFEGPRSFEELYDLQADADQVRNLADAPAHASRLGALRKALDDHMMAVNDNGFIPEGLPLEGYEPSREKAAYPLSRLMELGAKAASRDAKHLSELTSLLGDANAVIRHWAAQGLLMLAARATPAKAALAAVMKGDPVPQNRVVAAEAVATIAPSAEAITVLADILDGTEPWPVKLQALNSLTFLGDQAKAALPGIKAAAGGKQEYLRNAARFLEAVLEGRYEPSYPVVPYQRPG